MKKFLLVIFITIVLAINVYGNVNEIMKDVKVKTDVSYETVTIVYEE